MGATKFPANSDRWAEDGVFSRDLIDLAMIELTPDQWNTALEKAESAYGKAIRQDLHQTRNDQDPRRLAGSLFAGLSISLPKTLIWERLRALEKRVDT